MAKKDFHKMTEITLSVLGSGSAAAALPAAMQCTCPLGRMMYWVEASSEVSHHSEIAKTGGGESRLK